MDVIHTADVESPIGTLRFACTDQGLAYIQLPHQNGRGFDGWRTRHAPAAEIKPGFEPNRRSIAQVVEFLEGKRRTFDLPLDLRCTEFQTAVYDAVADIPYGEVCSYADVADRIGKPTAVRAVGAANGANPIPLVVPCHRVIAKSGHLQGYGGGLDLKARLLAMERGEAHPARLL